MQKLNLNMSQDAIHNEPPDCILIIDPFNLLIKSQGVVYTYR